MKTVATSARAELDAKVVSGPGHPAYPYHDRRRDARMDHEGKGGRRTPTEDGRIDRRHAGQRIGPQSHEVPHFGKGCQEGFEYRGAEDHVTDAGQQQRPESGDDQNQPAPLQQEEGSAAPGRDAA